MCHCILVQNMRVQLGWLFVPEAYITATRQYVAQANSWSLEELFLKVFPLLYLAAGNPQKEKDLKRWYYSV